MVGALGVVFGDIGTSPLYTMRAVLEAHGDMTSQDEAILGVLSIIAWCLIGIVAFTFVGLITRADNDGEGGILSLASYLTRRTAVSARIKGTVLVVAMAGAALFFGDSLITPAISVLSAAEGLQVVSADLSRWVLPLAVIVLSVLFLLQRKGTEHIGRLFGPVMSIWFVIVGALGLPHIIANPAVLGALNPWYAIRFALDNPGLAFVSAGGAMLAVTGAEALYADLGHFGRGPIVRAWFCLVFPCLLLNYFGQGAMLLADPATISSPFFNLAPAWGRIPLVILATMATVIASQSVISGAFSTARQAVRLHLLPRLKVVQTSEDMGGRIYLPAVNGALFCGVLLLMLMMGSSDRLASAYGIAITGTLLLDLGLFLLFARIIWSWSWVKVIAMAATIGVFEVLLFSANTLKIVSGGWFPIAVAVVVVTVMATWKRGSHIMFGGRAVLEGSISEFVDHVRHEHVVRVPGVAVYPHGGTDTTPLALRTSVEFAQVLHERVVILTVVNAGVPHVACEKRVCLEVLGDPADGLVRVTYKVGFKDSQNVPEALRLAVAKNPGVLDFDPADAWYVLSVFRLEPDDSPTRKQWPRWQRGLFRWLERMSANRTQVFHLPPERTVVNGEAVLV
ncbi:MAG: KUP/HAK/KT family potassium transporter [Propionibacteriaceae bacterium]|nr:KUP/HAK/KT family potassium transporter [Propionibacteriaceae bacterium]